MVGVVTHVVLENPISGYGLLITNMLNEKYKKTGIGVVTSPVYGKIYCQIFTN